MTDLESEEKTSNGALIWVQDYLSRRSHSEKELFAKLEKKGFNFEDSSYAINYAKKRKWLEEPEELALKVYREWDSKNKSHQWINGYLAEKGLPSQEKNADREAEKVCYHIRKKFGIIGAENHEKALANIATKGFSYDECKKGLELLKEENNEEC